MSDHEYTLEQLQKLARMPLLPAHLPDYYGAVKQLLAVLTERNALIDAPPIDETDGARAAAKEIWEKFRVCDNGEDLNEIQISLFTNIITKHCATPAPPSGDSARVAREIVDECATDYIRDGNDLFIRARETQIVHSIATALSRKKLKRISKRDMTIERCARIAESATDTETGKLIAQRIRELKLPSSQTGLDALRPKVDPDIVADRQFIEGAYFGWNCAIASTEETLTPHGLVPVSGAKQADEKFKVAIEGRLREIHEAKSCSLVEVKA